MDMWQKNLYSFERSNSRKKALRLSEVKVGMTSGAARVGEERGDTPAACLQKIEMISFYKTICFNVFDPAKCY